MNTRRNFIRTMTIVGSGLMLPVQGLLPRTARAQAIPGGTLPPDSIPKYVAPLVVPPIMPKSRRKYDGKPFKYDYYEIAVRQFQQQILPPGFPVTTVWGYGAVDYPGTVFEGGSFHSPSLTIEARYCEPVRVNWINDLVDRWGNYLPHLLPVDQTLHWANPPGGVYGRDDRGADQYPYTGPVPIVTHLHGGHTHPESDGYPEAWYLPKAKNIPHKYARVGSLYKTYQHEFEEKWGGNWKPGTATFHYPNDQRAATLWFHDHTLGITRLNVYAGPAGFYLLRGGPGDLPPSVLPSGPFEVPLAIQDRSFNADGSLFYPNSRAFFDGYTGPFFPQTDVPPIWNPEFFGNTIMVNGRTWPYFEVEPRRYRFRILNGSNSRFLILKTDNGMPFWQIGSEGGFLPAPVQLNQLLMGNAERADVILDFTGLAGATVTLLNVGPDSPFGGLPIDPAEIADPNTTGQVMQFRVTLPLSCPDTSVPPNQLSLPDLPGLPGASCVRSLSLNEQMSTVPGFDGPVAALLGLVGTDAVGNPVGIPRHWDDPITENPALGATEIWELYNFTADAHPIHPHLIMFQVINRQDLVTGAITAPEPWETGYKDTVVAYPGQITRIKAKFDIPGLYVWHCHILEHEDNEMMRPYYVGRIGKHDKWKDERDENREDKYDDDRGDDKYEDKRDS